MVGKILREKEQYYYRNMKRGATKEELGLSSFMFWFYKVKMALCPKRPNVQIDEEESLKK